MENVPANVRILVTPAHFYHKQTAPSPVVVFLNLFFKIYVYRCSIYSKLNKKKSAKQQQKQKARTNERTGKRVSRVKTRIRNRGNRII